MASSLPPLTTPTPGHPAARLGFYYGWIIVSTTALTLAVVYGFRFSFSVFFVAILAEFGWERAATAGILSVNVLVYGALAALSGALVDRFGPRVIIPVGVAILSSAILLSSQATALWHFYLLFGVIGAVGTAMSGYVPNFVILTNWFVKRRGTAFGVAQAGGGGSFLVAALAQVLITAFGWRAAYLLLGSIFGGLIVLLTWALQRRWPQDLGLTPDGESVQEMAETLKRPAYRLEVVDEQWVATLWTLVTALKTPRFWALFLANLLIWGFGFSVIATHQAAYAGDNGHSPTVIALMVGLYGMWNIGGNLCGFLADRLGREAAYTLGASCACLGVVALLLATDPSQPWLLLTYSALFGFGLGMVAPAMSAAHADLFQGPHFGAINGLIVAGFGLGGSFAPWLAGYIFDRTNTYLPAFLLSLFSIAAACGLMWVARPSAVRAIRRVEAGKSPARNPA